VQTWCADSATFLRRIFGTNNIGRTENLGLGAVRVGNGHAMLESAQTVLVDDQIISDAELHPAWTSPESDVTQPPPLALLIATITLHFRGKATEG